MNSPLFTRVLGTPKIKPQQTRIFTIQHLCVLQVSFSKDLSEFDTVSTMTARRWILDTVQVWSFRWREVHMIKSLKEAQGKEKEMGEVGGWGRGRKMTFKVRTLSDTVYCSALQSSLQVSIMPTFHRRDQSSALQFLRLLWSVYISEQCNLEHRRPDNTESVGRLGMG